ncbi:PAS domain S-box protein [Aureibacter tunicatorum]|uniref:histidine kinase n=1 Tax=Aureibacter tunicatorum TaxID=866807 RepID=A0AAE4BRR2_9BACT|nr:PAS domain S-box protein [Aureibacter tunicatorum]MDR6237492.1 PAS domain S-box-containing protein [Aureibacter tunicatorum]BDD02526.1 hypothetical protein AUTU_00090 [Aureibacter tunicatorum]
MLKEIEQQSLPDISLTKELNILYLGNSYDDCSLLQSILNHTPYIFKSELIYHWDKAVNLIQKKFWDMIICPYEMNQIHSLDLIRYAKKNKITTPFIIISTEQNEEHAVKAIKFGARDYILKNNLKRLIPAIEREVNTHREKKEAITKFKNFDLSLFNDNILFEYSPAMVWIKDLENNILLANIKSEEYFVRNIKEINQKSLFELAPKYAKKYYEKDLKVIKTQQPLLGVVEPFENRYGEQKWIRTDRIPQFDQMGHITQILTFCLDVTEQKLKEIEKHNFSERLQAAIETNKIGLWEIDLKKNTLNLSDEFLHNVLKIREGQFDNNLDSVLKLFFSTEDYELIKENIAGYSNKKISGLNSCYKLQLSDKKNIYVSVKSKAIDWDENGDLTKITGTITDITHQKLSEVALSDSRFKLNDVQKISNIGNWQYSTKDGNVSISKEVIKLMEMEGDNERTQYKAKHFIKNIHPQDMRLVFTAVNMSLQNGESNEIKHRIVDKNGEVKWVINSIISKKDDKTGFDVVFGAIQDISSQKKALDQLRHSEKKYRLLVEQASDGIITFDQNGNITDFNSPLVDMLDISYENVADHSIYDILEFQENIELISTLDQNSNQSMLFDHIDLITYNNNKIPVEINAKKIDVNQYQAIIRDISERIIKDQELHRSHCKNSAILKAIPDTMLIINQEGIIIDFYDSHLNPNEYIGCYATAFFDENTFDAVKKGFEKAMKQSQTIIIEFQKPNHNTDLISYYEARIRVKQDKKFLVIVRNITDKIKANNKLVEVNHDLETFMYKSSHNLKGPIASILGMVNVFKLDVEDDKSLQYISMLEESALTLNNTLEELVEVAKVKQDVNYIETISFENILNNCIKILEKKYAHENIEFQLENNQNNPLNSDAKLINKILMHILDNAIKFRSTRRSPSIFISINGNMHYTYLSIKDNGNGIIEKFHDNIFDMFFRASEKSVGSGLGLYICKQAVKRIKGQISIHKSDETGTTMLVSLPNLGKYNF